MNNARATSNENRSQVAVLDNLKVHVRCHRMRTYRIFDPVIFALLLLQVEMKTAELAKKEEELEHL